MIKRRLEELRKPKIAAIVIRDGREVHMTEEEYERFKEDEGRDYQSLEDYMKELGKRQKDIPEEFAEVLDDEQEDLLLK